MSNTVIQRQFSLEPRCMNAVYRRHLYKKICQTLLHKCDKTYGYILEIDENFEIVSNTFSAAGQGVFFDVKLTAKTLKPEIGDAYVGKVCMVMPQGVFVLVEQMKIMVPKDRMAGFEHQKGEACFAKGKGTVRKVIQLGSRIRVTIDLIKYEKQTFGCIGSLKTLLP